MDTRKRSYDSTHSYAARGRVTEILPGTVFWNNQSEGWSFNVIIDGVTVRSNNRYPRECIAREALRLEVNSIRDMLANTAAVVEADIDGRLGGDDDRRRFAVGMIGETNDTQTTSLTD